MTGSGNPIQPAELTLDGEHLDQEVATALAVARRLESELHATETTTPSSDFGDRVMAAIAREPRPRAVAFLAPLERRRSLAGLRESVALAWRVVVGATLPTRARASALAYVLAILLVAASATTFAAYGAAGALGWFGTSPTLSPPPANPNATAAPTNPLGEPGDSAEPSESLETGDSPEPGASGLAEPEDSGGADSTGNPSTDGGTSSSISGDDHGGTASPTSSAGATQTPKPSGTPKASQTPEPSGTPSPTSSSHG